MQMTNYSNLYRFKQSHYQASHHQNKTPQSKESLMKKRPSKTNYLNLNIDLGEVGLAHQQRWHKKEMEQTLPKLLSAEKVESASAAISPIMINKAKPFIKESSHVIMLQVPKK